MGRLKQFLALVFAACVLVLLVVQLALTTPEARDALAEHLSGVPVASSASSGVVLGELTLTLEGVPPTSDIKVLQNGIPISVFNQQTIIVLVEDNSLIEIDGTETQESFKVSLDATSENVELFRGVRQILVQNNIAILDRIFVEE